MQTIPMVDLAAEYQLLKAELEPAVLAVMASGYYVLGPNVRALEAEIAAYCGVRHAIALGSGTDALVIALRAAGIGPGDEVVTTPFSFIATASAIAMCGAQPVFADIDRRTCNIAPNTVEAVLSPRTRAVVPVHLFGQPAELAPIASLCRTHGLILIEDAAQAFGAEIGGRKTGAYGDAGCFSFYPSKNLGAFGDGGMIVTDDDALADSARRLADHGREDAERFSTLGYNSRLDELQAAILRVKLARVDEFNAARRRRAQAYHARLSHPGLELPYEDGVGLHVYHQYTLRTGLRDELRQALTAAGIASSIYYPIPLHRQEPYASQYRKVSLPVAELAARQVLSLPISPLLQEAQIDRIAEVVLGALPAVPGQLR
ncbi:MAG: DegT/DnrJ/EryC1/StrS family aminotransferase [Pseudomonadales bacterium]